MQAQSPAPAPVLLPWDWERAKEGQPAWTPDWLASPPPASQPVEAVPAPVAYLPADWND